MSVSGAIACDISVPATLLKIVYPEKVVLSEQFLNPSTTRLSTIVNGVLKQQKIFSNWWPIETLDTYKGHAIPTNIWEYENLQKLYFTMDILDRTIKAKVIPLSDTFFPTESDMIAKIGHVEMYKIGNCDLKAISVEINDGRTITGYLDLLDVPAMVEIYTASETAPRERTYDRPIGIYKLK